MPDSEAPTGSSRVRAAWLGPGNLPDNDKIEYWYEKALREIHSKIEDLAERLAAEELEDPKSTTLKDLVEDVAVDMTIRKLQNPAGLRSRNKSTGPFVRSETLAGENPGELALTDKELAKLSRKRVKTGDIDLVPPTARLARTGWW